MEEDNIVLIVHILNLKKAVNRMSLSLSFLCCGESHQTPLKKKKKNTRFYECCKKKIGLNHHDGLNNLTNCIHECLCVEKSMYICIQSHIKIIINVPFNLV